MLCSLDDIKRILKREGDSSLDSDLTAYLQVADEWTRALTGREFDATGTFTDQFFSVRPGDIVVVKSMNPTIIAVGVYAPGSTTSSALTVGGGYYPMDKGRVLISRYALSGIYNQVRPEERYSASFNSYYRVDVTYSTTSSIPASVRDAVAMIAASEYIRSTTEIDDKTSERLGDYSYARLAGAGKAADDRIPKLSRQFLQPYIKPKARTI